MIRRPRKNRFAGALVRASILVAGVATSANAREAPLEGRDYNEARATILRYGWTPQAGNCDLQGLSGQSCKIYPELRLCQPVEIGRCLMEFSKPGRCLIITTTEAPPHPGSDDVTIYDVFFSRKPCSGKS